VVEEQELAEGESTSTIAGLFSEICFYISLVTGMLASICMILFFTFVTKADQAMDKSGMGDYSTWARYDNMAGYFFYPGLGLWVICLILAVFSQQPYKRRLIIWFGLGLPFSVIYSLLLSIFVS
jgi:hypothetical protein